MGPVAKVAAAGGVRWADGVVGCRCSDVRDGVLLTSVSVEVREGMGTSISSV